MTTTPLPLLFSEKPLSRFWLVRMAGAMANQMLMAAALARRYRLLPG